MNKDKFIKNLFNKRIDIETLNLEFKKENRFALAYILSPATEREEFISLYGINTEGFPITWHGCSASKNEDYNYNFLLSYIIKYMIKGSWEENWNGYSTYFPTARTGYI